MTTKLKSLIITISCPGIFSTPAQLDQGWQSFRRYCDEQESWKKGQEGDVLKDCVSRLQNLREVLIDRAKPFGGRLNIQPFWRNFRNEILVGPDAWSYDASRWNSLDTLTAMFMVTAVGYRNSISGTKAVEKLALDLPEHWSFHDMVYLPSHYPNQIYIKAYPKSVDPATRYGVILDAFRPLKHLTLRCPSVDDDEDLDGIAQVEEANEILTTAVGLQSLYLDFGEPGRSCQSRIEGTVGTQRHNVPALARVADLSIFLSAFL
jgi:hypothetical protein